MEPLPEIIICKPKLTDPFNCKYRTVLRYDGIDNPACVCTYKEVLTKRDNGTEMVPCYDSASRYLATGRQANFIEENYKPNGYGV